MVAQAMDGVEIGRLVRMMIPVCRAAGEQRVARGRGRTFDFADWQIGIMIAMATLKLRKSKSAQYEYLLAHAEEVSRWLKLPRFPARSTYFTRFRAAFPFFEIAIRVQGEVAVDEGFTDPRIQAVDKSLLHARGPVWHTRDQRRRRRPRGVDVDATWGYSDHHGWVYGYSFEVLVTAGRKAPVFPMQASVDVASCSEHHSFAAKIPHLHEACIYVLVDAGYDNGRYTDAIEFDARGHRTGRRLIGRLQSKLSAALSCTWPI